MVGSTISHYNILEKLGEGGMGVVYKAQDLKLRRLVALKFLPPYFTADTNERERFLHEAQAAATLNHANIATVYEIDEHEERPFLAMELIEGQTLRNFIGKDPLKVDKALDIAVQISEGLAAAHENGVVHRDIKPENIMVTSKGLVKIMDFGLAKMKGVTNVTKEGSTLGTMGYMSPEQTRGELVDQRSDIFSLGVVLYEILTGTKPFRGEHQAAIAYSIVNEDPLPLFRFNNKVSEELERIIFKALQKNVDDRYQRIEDMQADVRRERRALESPRWHPVVSNPSGHDTRSIAVLPFKNLSDDKENEYFSEGLTEEIIANLSKLKSVRVVSRTSVMRYKREEKTMKQIAADLDVQFILEGSVRKHESDLRITTQLVDANRDASMWSEKYRGTMEDIFDIQEKVASKIVNALKVQLTPREKKTLKRRSTQNTEAYQLYLKGRFFWNKRNQTALEHAVHYFEDAIRMDSHYALAWAGLADSYNLMSEYGHATRAEMYPKAKAAVLQALAIDNELAEAHTSLASLLMLDEWDWTNSGKEFKRAIELQPSYATAHHWFAEWLMYFGKTEDALREATLAAQLDPLSPGIFKDKGMLFYYARQYNNAIEDAKKTLELDPQFATGHRLLSLVYEATGRFEEAKKENREWERTSGQHTVAMLALAHIHARAGEQVDALSIIKTLAPEQLNDGYDVRAIALVYAALRQHDLAFQWLEKAFEMHSPSLFTLRVDPKLDEIRSDPRFDTLLSKVGLEK